MGFPDDSVVKNLLLMKEPQEMQVQSLGWEDPLEEGLATHSSILVWRIPMDPMDLVGPGGWKELDMTWVTKHSTARLYLDVNTLTTNT